MAHDPMKGKNYAGSHPGMGDRFGLHSQPSYEPMGVHRSAPNPKLAVEGGHTEMRDGSEGPNLNPLSRGYAGPDRLNNNYTNKGVVNPDDIQDKHNPV